MGREDADWEFCPASAWCTTSVAQQSEVFSWDIWYLYMWSMTYFCTRCSRHLQWETVRTAGRPVPVCLCVAETSLKVMLSGWQRLLSLNLHVLVSITKARAMGTDSAAGAAVWTHAGNNLDSLLFVISLEDVTSMVSSSRVTFQPFLQSLWMV